MTKGPPNPSSELSCTLIGEINARRPGCVLVPGRLRARDNKGQGNFLLQRDGSVSGRRDGTVYSVCSLLGPGCWMPTVSINSATYFFLNATFSVDRKSSAYGGN